MVTNGVANCFDVNLNFMSQLCLLWVFFEAFAGCILGMTLAMVWWQVLRVLERRHTVMFDRFKTFQEIHWTKVCMCGICLWIAMRPCRFHLSIPHNFHQSGNTRVDKSSLTAQSTSKTRIKRIENHWNILSKYWNTYWRFVTYSSKSSPLEAWIKDAPRGITSRWEDSHD